MRLALLGTRGPGSYGGFETCVAELAPRLHDLGHDVTVYARSSSAARSWRHEGVEVVALPSVPTKSLDTITHTAVCVPHVLRHRPDVAIVFGVGNSPYAWTLRKAGVPVVLNVDGLDRQRAKWGRLARRYLQAAERLSVRAADVVVTDAHTITRYYRDCYAADTTYIPYGGPDGPVSTTGELERWGLRRRGYILYVSRLEPENNAHVLIEAYANTDLDVPLVVVGGGAYESGYERRLHELAGPGVVFTGFVFGRGYVELQSHACLYVQCTEVGGTHPALVEAMGYGNAVIALDTPEHREVLADTGDYYTSTPDLADRLVALMADEERRSSLRDAARARARAHFSWDAVASQYVAAAEAAQARH